MWQKEKLLRRHSAHALYTSGEEEHFQSAKKKRVTVDFSLLAVLSLPETNVHAALSLPLQEVFLLCGLFS